MMTLTFNFFFKETFELLSFNNQNEKWKTNNDQRENQWADNVVTL